MADTGELPGTVHSPAAAATVDSMASDPQEMVNSMGLVLLESSNQPRFVGTSSGITFAKMVLAAIKEDVPTENIPSPGRTKRRLVSSAPSAAHVASSLPPRHAAQHIIDVYFSYRISHVPILQRARVNDSMDRVYTACGVSHQDYASVPEGDLFITYMVLAIGLYGMPMAGGSPPQQSEGCFNSALQCVDTLLAYSPSDLETLTTVLLLAQYIALNPSRGSLRQLTGMALRLCVDLGLHWETSAVLAMPQHTLNERRMLYWATYRLDRFLCITLGRPFGIAELSMNTGLPDPYISEIHGSSGEANREVDNQRCANHIVNLYRLESEIKHVLYHQLQGATLAYPRANYGLWFRDIQSRLRAWQGEIPTLSRGDPESMYSQPSWWEAHVCNALLLLHRPNPLVPHPTTESLQICFDVARRSIKAIKTLQREGRSAEVRNAASVVDVMTTTQDCATTLAALTERFADASGCRDVFESLSSVTLRWVVAKDQDSAAESHEPALGAEIDALRELVPFSTAGWQAEEPASIFPDEPFEFAQYLSAAAQWQSSTDRATTLSFADILDL